MQNDKTTLKDLSIFPTDGSDGLFGLIDRTATQVGRDALRRHILKPPSSHEHLVDMQRTIQFWCTNLHRWPTVVLNGTIVMLDKFYESADTAHPPPTGIARLLMPLMQKVFNKQEYFFTRFSLSHLSDFLKGCTQLAVIAEEDNVPPLLLRDLKAMQEELQHPLVEHLMSIHPRSSFAELAKLQYQARRDMKNMIYRLLDSFARLDAWQSMARATVEHKWTFPELLPELPVTFNAKGIYHPLLDNPISYDIDFSNGKNFMLLTGANMSGKTTFMRALGTGSLMAHLGMGVPAAAMRASFMQGIITNMHTEDNIMKGESYFFAEVKRMKQIAAQLQQQRPHFALMDELFKGTNVHDAYECTRAVVEGLMHHPNHIMILSTHLYEVAQHFSSNANILFSYFVTNMSHAGSYTFTYELKEGISNDRIGYIILQKEGVIDMLRQQH